MSLLRKSGILLHPVSLPGEYGIGELGSEAYQFVDFLSKAKQTLWQILPLAPADMNGCPYNSHSAFAGNSFLISTENLKELELISDVSSFRPQVSDNTRINYGEVYKFKERLLSEAFIAFGKKWKYESEFNEFCRIQSFWLEDFALFSALKEKFAEKSWTEWPKDFMTRKPDVLENFKKEVPEKIKKYKFIQWLFFRQWSALKKYANSRGIKIIGDIPIFVSLDSSDVWSNQDIFKIKDGKPVLVSGVPPDYFSPTGQFWGNPLYDWEELKKRDFIWWKKRFSVSFQLYDIVRLDHFRGFEACWAIPAEEKSAVNGSWEKTLGRELFISLQKNYKELPIIAEDLGDITDDVIKLRDDFNFPGMKILQFAFFEGSGHHFLPHNFESHNCAVYTGTHDNDTITGWFKSLDDSGRLKIKKYIPDADITNINWKMIEFAQSSVAKYCIIPIQDILGTGVEGRFNCPGLVCDKNWSWRFIKDNLTENISFRLSEITERFNRYHNPR